MGKTIRRFGNDGLKRIKPNKETKHKVRFDAFIDDEDDEVMDTKLPQNSDDSDQSDNG